MKRKLLLLHGALGNSQQFDELRKIIVSEYELHTLNFSGHGGNRIIEQFSIALFVEDVLKYLDTYQIDAIDIFGYSMGGYVALMLARDYSSKINKVMTLGTKFKWTPESAAKEMRMLNPEIIEEKVPKFAEALRLKHHPEDWKQVLRETCRMMELLGNGEALTEEDLKTIHQDVLISVGAEDNMVSEEESRWAAELLSNGRFKSIPEFKHPIEAVDQVKLGELIIEYFTKIDVGT